MAGVLFEGWIEGSMMDSEEFQKKMLAMLVRRRKANPEEKKWEQLEKICQLAGSIPINAKGQVKEHGFETLTIKAEIIARLRREYESGATQALPEAVTRCWNWRFTIPVWAERTLAHAFHDYLDNEGATNLNDSLGLKWSQGRNNTPFSIANEAEKRFSIVYHILTLNKGLGFTLPVSFRILHKKGIDYIRTNGTDDTAYLSINRISDIYKEDKNLPIFKGVVEDALAMDSEDKFDEFLRSYADAFHTAYDDPKSCDPKERRLAHRQLKKITQAGVDVLQELDEHIEQTKGGGV